MSEKLPNPQVMLMETLDASITDGQLAPVLAAIGRIPGVTQVINERYAPETQAVLYENFLRNKATAEANGWEFPHVWDDPSKHVQCLKIMLHHDWNHDKWDEYAGWDKELRGEPVKE